MSAELVWKAEDVIRALGGQYLHEQTWEAHGVSIDSRTTKKGDIFFALIGPNDDGHEYVKNAFEAGAAAAIVSRQPPQVAKDAPLIFVEDTLTAMEFLGHANRERCQARIVAVTGSVGKTSTKEMLRLMLSAMGDTYANEGSLNNHWGVPLSLARMPQSSNYGVFEMGMNHAGELTALSRQVKPHVALITTIEAVHLEHFESVEAIADAKAEIFYGMQAINTPVLNKDNNQYERLFALASGNGFKQIFSFGRNAKEGRMKDCVATSDGSTVTAEILGRTVNYHLPVFGEHMALNSVGALLSAVAAGGDIEACAAALQHFTQPKGRGVIQTITAPQGNFMLIDESYNASPVALRAAIRVLSQMPIAKGRRLLALGDMKELGTSAPEMHAALAKDIIDAKIDLVFSCGEMMAHLNGNLPDSIRGGWAKDSTDLAPMVAAAMQGGDIITVKGSNSVKM
ncbi:MAG TPA: UDP-N-acetylmuramoyl-tripeptide--D-alanyl-D-alanine ligase, partial [Alphaproteobacteria bacterium]|nr:UDP-N-acetylmuramoyl-tripeptide--D-alanyl-D-alanine ligase [Alphaproteobacteria bacterium]